MIGLKTLWRLRIPIGTPAGAHRISGQDCATRYPILLVHGTGFRDWTRLGYWGRIPELLRQRGAAVYFGQQDGWATVEDNARCLARRVDQILAETGCEKLNLIAHSKGGLDARYLISSLGYGDRAASLTTVSTPHRGSRTMDALDRLPRWVFRLLGVFVNGWYRLIGDASPDFCGVCRQFTTAWAEAFNQQNPDVPGVLYQSWAGAMAGARSDLFLWWSNLIINRMEGENDGLVTVESARWTNFGGVWRGSGSRGMSHMDEVDFRRRPLKGRDGPVDPAERYAALVEGLRKRGL